ncbi:ribosomal protein S5 domain 2-type protein [Limtongia smithiae]|uniref:ribosomal protein S5 domain 2-type protein n=1 Tax=Limtongia smithiae TaxID=1125753 RepID=UPI0034CDDDD0
MTASSVCFSAPGKALVAGGYLVLYPENSSFVTALSARIYAIGTPSGTPEGKDPTVVVCSPQFKEGEWGYVLHMNKVSGYVSLSPTDPSRKNPFVWSAIATSLNYLSARKLLPKSLPSLAINILSDNAYHSQPSDTVPRFNKHAAQITAVPKTGLGSSAALTTSLVATLLQTYGGVDPTSVKGQSVLHNVAQLAHCTAQGKVGSGFDVACAVYGSIMYRRFPAIMISSLPPAPDASVTAEEESDYLDALVERVDSDWGAFTRPCAVPRGLRLLMGDVAGGSETPSMVQKVQRWRSDGGDKTEAVWRSLGKANVQLIEALTGLGVASEKSPVEYDAFLAKILAASANSAAIKSLGADSGHKTGLLFEQAVQAISSIRENLRTMTAGSGAQVEPEEQTVLLDTCSNFPGVVGGVVPGAGGYDAVCLLATNEGVASLVGTVSKDLEKVKWLDLREEAEGLRKESIELLSKFL